MKRIAETQETIVRVPVILEPVEVQIPLLAVPVEVRDVAVAVPVLPDQCAKYHLNHCPSITLGTVSYLGPLSPPISRTK